MKLIKISLLSLVFFALTLTWSCGPGDETPVTLAFLERITGTWTISSAQENGTTMPASDYTGFSLTITETSFTLTPGALDADQRPNYSSTGNNGTFVLTNNNTQIVFDGKTAAAVTITASTPTDVTKKLESVTIRFTTDAKDAPTYTYVLVRS